MKSGSRFRFPLETVLKVRTLREDLARLELARAQGQLVRSRQALTDTESHIAAALSRIKEGTTHGWKASEYQMLFRYVDHLRLARAGWLEQITRDETTVAEKMRALEKCHQERRLLENLRSKRYSEFRREMAKVLEKQNEAIVLARWTSS
jgi:flagellar protein FliJ